MKNLITFIATISLMTLLVACPVAPIPNVNGVYSGYVQATNGNRVTAALALRNDGQVAVKAGFAILSSGNVVAIPLSGSMNGNNFTVSYSDSSGSMSINGAVNSGTITGSFALNTNSGNTSGTIYFTYYEALSAQNLRMFDGLKGSLEDLSRALF